MNRHVVQNIGQAQVLLPMPSVGKYQHSPLILRIVRRLLDDVDAAKVAREFGVSRNYVYFVRMAAETAGLLAALKRRMPLEKRRERIARILEMEQANYSAPLIARKLGVSKSWVYRVCDQHRVKSRRRPLADRQPQITIEIIADLLQGLPRQQIARERRVSTIDIASIRVRANKAGIEFPADRGISYHRKMSREARQYISQLISFLSPKEIAKVFDISVASVHRTARRHGIKRRKGRTSSKSP